MKKRTLGTANPPTAGNAPPKTRIRFMMFLRSMSGTNAPSSTRACLGATLGAWRLGATKAEAVAARAASTAVRRDGISASQPAGGGESALSRRGGRIFLALRRLQSVEPSVCVAFLRLQTTARRRRVEGQSSRWLQSVEGPSAGPIWPDSLWASFSLLRPRRATKFGTPHHEGLLRTSEGQRQN